MIDIYVCKMTKLFGFGGGEGEEGYSNIVFSAILISFFSQYFCLKSYIGLQFRQHCI